MAIEPNHANPPRQGQMARIAASAVAIDMVDVEKWFGRVQILKRVSLRVFGGERIVVCGPSGSGKSTLLRCINRLEEHQAGKIVVDGIELSDDIKRVD